MNQKLHLSLKLLFAMTHKSVCLFVFCLPGIMNPRNQLKTKEHKSPNVSCLNPAAGSENHECFNCYEPEHLIAVCPVLRKEEQSKNKRHFAVGLIHGESVTSMSI